jgi:hypothetical protein
MTTDTWARAYQNRRLAPASEFPVHLLRDAQLGGCRLGGGRGRPPSDSEPIRDFFDRARRETLAE